MIKTYKNGTIFYKNSLIKKDITINDNTIVNIGDNLNEGEIIDVSNKLIAPSFADPHVHLREPGFTHKETIKTGYLSAINGGYTTLFLMPNLNPVPSNVKVIKEIYDIIKRDSKIDMIQLASITTEQKGHGSLVDFKSLSEFTVGFSDDGKGIFNTKDMYEAMLEAKKYNKTIIAHCEDEGLLYGGYIREGIYSKKNNHKGILNITETTQLARDLVLALQTKVHYHVCHVSVKESVDLIRFYKSLGCNVTCEVSPHHLTLTENDLKEDGNFKMNPPLGSLEDRDSLIQGLIDGTIDCIATDHAPHSFDEKNKGLEKSMFGIVGLETSFPLLYTNLVLKGLIKLEDLLKLMSKKVFDIFKLEDNEIDLNKNANLVIIDLNKEYLIDKNSFKSKSNNTPFDGYKVKGQIVSTIYKGEVLL